MSDKTVSIERGLGGEIQEINKKNNLNLVGIVDASDYILLIEMREKAERRKINLNSIFDRCERRLRASNYEKLRISLNDDISKMASVMGHKDTGKKKNPLEGLLRV